MSGWVKLHRKMLKWEWYGDTNAFRLFMHLLLKAEYEPTRFQGHVVPVGGCVTGIHKLADQTGMTSSQVRTALKKLESTQEIAIKTTNKFSIISICKWADYQTDDKQVTNKSQTDDKRIATSKEIKKERKKEEIYPNEFELFWEAYPRQRRGSKSKAFAAWQKAQERDENENIMAGLIMYRASDEVAKGYAKGAAAWLNDDRWANEYTPQEKPPDKPKTYGGFRA